MTAIEIPEDRTYYILAAHPGFLPIKHCEKNDLELKRETEYPPHVSAWDCAEHPRTVDSSKSVEDQMGSLPDIGRVGWFTVSPYNDLAHFLTIRKYAPDLAVAVRRLEASLAPDAFRFGSDVLPRVFDMLIAGASIKAPKDRDPDWGCNVLVQGVPDPYSSAGRTGSLDLKY